MEKPPESCRRILEVESFWEEKRVGEEKEEGEAVEEREGARRGGGGGGGLRCVFLSF